MREKTVVTTELYNDNIEKINIINEKTGIPLYRIINNALDFYFLNQRKNHEQISIS